MNAKRKKPTLVELLAIVGIVGFLALLMIPAQQAAREAGSKAKDATMLGMAVRGAEGVAASAPADGYAAHFSQNAAGEKTPGDRPIVPPTARASADRKIIYTANVELVVEDFSGVAEKVAALVQRLGGYVADSTVTGQTGQNRRANWRVRVPVDHFDEFVQSAGELGELITASTNSQDVSEEYADVEARIRNKTQEEQRLLKLLEERPGKLEDVIAIERELSRAREELERMQGRERVLADRTSLTSVQLNICEVRNFEPPQAATFATRVRRAFEGSVEALVSTGQGLVVAGAMLAPWLALTVVLLGALYPVCRALLRKSPAAQAPLS